MTRVLGHSSDIVTRIAKTEEQTADPQEVYRLHDMEVEEVSLVDRAANKRKFLVVKRSDSMSTTQVHPDGKGGFTSAAGTNKAGAPPTPPAAAAPPAKDPKKKPPVPGAAVGKAGALEVPPGFKEMMGPLLEASATRLQALADSVDSSKPGAMTDEGDMPGVPPEFSNELAAIVGQLEKAGSMFPNAPAELTDTEDADGATPAAESTPAPTEMQLRAAEKSMGTLLAFAKRALVHKVAVQKLGAKMSKDRLSRLQQAVGALSNLVSEVAGQPALPPAPAEKSASPELAELTKAVAGLASVVKGTQADVQAIKKVRGMPSSATVEAGGPDKITKSDENYSWPLDMNREITRENVDKKESFFGDD